MNTILKRVISLVLCFVLATGYLPVSAFATENRETVTTETTEVTTEPTQAATEETEVPSESAALAEQSEETDGSDEDEKESKEAEKETEKEAKKEEKESKKETEPYTEPSTEATDPSTEPTKSTEPEVIAVTGITLDRVAVEVGVGELPMTLTATVMPEDATDKTVTWTSSEPGVVSVENGELTFGYMGTATITATAGEFSASCTVTVGEGEDSWYEYTGPAYQDAAIFFSDLHTSQSDYKESTVKSIMTALKNTGLTFSSVTSCGDAFSVNYSYSEYTGYTSTITGYIQNVLGEVPVNYVWSDHDRYAVQEDGSTLLDNESGFIYGAGADGAYGTDDDDNYYIYELSMADLSTYNRYSADFNSNEEVTDTIAAFVADAAKLDQTKPLFIASHQPLFDRRNDNGHALEWCNAINEVAEDMDVAFFFGHNHNYDVASDYYYAKGSTMSVCKDSSGNAENVEINFTHICAGYMAPASTNSTSNTTRQGVAVAVTIFEDSIRYATYDANGVYTGSYALDATVDRDHAEAETEEPEDTQPTEPSEPEETDPTVPSEPETEEKQDEATRIVVKAPGLTGIDVAEIKDTAVYDALTGKLTDYVGYDIKALGYTDGDRATVIMPIPEGVSNPAVYYVSDDGETVENMNAVKDGNGNVTFTTDHFSYYVIGEDAAEEPDSGSVTVGGITTADKSVYVKVNSLEANGEYLIINTDKNQMLVNSNGYDGTAAVTVVAGNVTVGNTTYTEYIENPVDTGIWTAKKNDNGFNLVNSNQYLVPRDSSDMVSNSAGSAWSYSSNHLSGSVTSYPWWGGGSTTYYVRYSNGEWSNSTTQSEVYLYKKVTAKVEVSNQVTYTMQAADLDVVLPESGTTTGQLEYAVLGNGAPVTLNGSSTFGVAGDTDGIISDISNTGLITFSGKEGSCRVKIAYTWDANTVYKYVTVTAKAPYYSIELCEPVTVDGETKYEPITAPIAKKGVVANQTMNVWAVVKQHDAVNPEGKDLGTVTDHLLWSVSDESIATIDSATGVITFTGENFGTFQVTVYYLDGENNPVCSDTITISASESQYVVPGDGTDDFPEYPNEGAVRYDKTATAVGNFSETGIAKVELSMTGVPYTTNNKLDVVLMLDRSSSMTDTRIAATKAAVKVFIKNVVMNEDGTFNGNRIYIGDFLGGNPEYAGQSQHNFKINNYTTNEEDGYQIVNDTNEYNALLAKVDSTFVRQNSSYGTEYAQSLEYCYNLLNSTKADGNKQFCVFMSDGIPNVFQYSESGKYESTGDLAEMFTGTNYNTRSNKYHYEYHSTRMKANGVTVFAVGLGLENTNSAWSGVSATACLNAASLMLNDISGPAGETTPDTGTALSKKDNYFFSVADANAAADMENVFGTIAQKIVEAAKDVVVEDKIGSNYTVNFSIPGYGTENAVSEDALDGTTEFYIQVVEYQLNADKERTGEPTVLENFTFNADGTFKSHTVNGTTCSNCSHVTTSGGTITKIDGTYFDYEVKADGEFLTWNAEKLFTTELALQYFAYLDSSSGVKPEDQIAAGTYYTNDYATLTYTNYKGNRVQREFPIPQMTWNGAQVSYVFYLVNEDGQPVNRAGRVVPFAEAVYVTDVYTYSVIWNDLEQSAGLEAKYLADELVPDVYALYDDDATYQIHVYENENEVNLNNHFIIGGDVNDDYNNTTDRSWTNAKTTYVFNNKSDATKYNEVGAYIANDGNDSSKATSYYCKSAAIEGATYTTSVDAAGVTVYTVTGLGSGYQQVSGETQVAWNDLPSKTGATKIEGYAYYVDENDAVYTIVQKTDGKEVEQGFDFHNTTVAFAVVWKPELAEDTVVVDYGLDVVIDVITNDNMAAGVVGVRSDKPNAEINSGSYKAAKAQTVDVYIDSNNDGSNLKENKIGTASVQSLNQVRFSLDDTNGMQFTDPAVFYYEADVNYYDTNGELQTTSMYSSVTVIPATTVYYEDDFLTLDSFTKSGDTWTQDETSKWTASVQNGVQDQDRPGASKISAALDADNNYGYDSAYETMATHSLNNSAHITVDAGTRGEATFTFYGTGFDVIGLTSNTTGTLLIQVNDANGNMVKNAIVDTYYGYTRNDAGEWVTFVNDPNALYQVPVMKIAGLDYGKYTAKIMAVYNDVFNHTTTEASYELYLDAIRIYDPTGNLDETANNAYVADDEAWPTYVELRNNVISASGYTVTENEDGTVTVTGKLKNGAVFIDCNDKAELADYVSYGPNNELYLAKNQAVAFTVTDADIADIQLGIKVANGGSVTYKINGDSYTVETTTDMYYSIKDYAKDGKTVVIENVSGGILSLTNIKVTHTTAPDDPSGISLLSMDAESVGYALMSLRAPVVEDVPETTVPEETEPEETAPETSEPEKTEPEETKPDKDAEKLEKELKKALEKAAKEAEKLAKELQKAADKAAKALFKLLGNWF